VDDPFVDIGTSPLLQSLSRTGRNRSTNFTKPLRSARAMARSSAHVASFSALLM
jgi:hypothetical protein